MRHRSRQIFWREALKDKVLNSDGYSKRDVILRKSTGYIWGDLRDVLELVNRTSCEMSSLTTACYETQWESARGGDTSAIFMIDKLRLYTY